MSSYRDIITLLMISVQTTTTRIVGRVLCSGTDSVRVALVVLESCR